MRIVGGRFKGRALAGPKSSETRPTSDRVRESMFNILAHGISGFEIEGARVIDLFAGTGALGFEALSRGAKFCQFVEEASEARGIIRNNADGLGVLGICKIWRRDATDLGRCEPQSPFRLAFCDPPYNRGLGAKCLTSLVAGNWLEKNAVVVFEESTNYTETEIAGLELFDQRDYGDTKVMMLRHTKSET